jgi:hypothetical protein
MMASTTPTVHAPKHLSCSRSRGGRDPGPSGRRDRRHPPRARRHHFDVDAGALATAVGLHHLSRGAQQCLAN